MNEKQVSKRIFTAGIDSILERTYPEENYSYTDLLAKLGKRVVDEVVIPTLLLTDDLCIVERE